MGGLDTTCSVLSLVFNLKYLVMRKFSFLLTLVLQVFGGTLVWGQQRVMSLGEMFALADSLNSVIKVSNLAVSEAKAGVEVTRNAYLPSIEASVLASYNGDGYIMNRDFTNGFGVDIPSFGNNFKFEVNQVIFAGGAIKSAVEMSEIGTELATLDAVRNRNEVRFLIAGDYIELCKLANQKKVLDDNIALAQTVADVMRSRVDNGAALKTDVTRMELLVKNLEYARIQIDGAEKIVRRELANALGMSLDAEIIPADELDEMSVVQLNMVESEVLASSPAVKAADAMVRMSEQQVRMAKSERYPKISLFAGEYMDGPVLIEVPTLNNNFNYWAVGVGIRYNIDNLYKSHKSINKSRIAASKSREQLNVAKEQISLAFNAAETDYQNAFILLDTKTQSVALAQESYELVRYRYEEGLAVITDLLDASSQLLDAQIQEVNAKMNIAYNYYRLKYISGTI